MNVSDFVAAALKNENDDDDDGSGGGGDQDEDVVMKDGDEKESSSSDDDDDDRPRILLDDDDDDVDANVKPGVVADNGGTDNVASPVPPSASSSMYPPPQMYRERTAHLYDLSHYTIGSKGGGKRRHRLSKRQRSDNLQRQFEERGTRRVVEGVLLVHLHGHPHLLLLNDGDTFKLPGGRLRPDEEEVSGLKRKLSNKLQPAELPIKWDIGELLASWWQISIEGAHYPYQPPHVTNPTETRRVFLVNLPKNCHFAVPSSFNLSAVPLFELHNNSETYGMLLSNLPHVLSRLSFMIL